jgi:hypothetical protein
MSEPSFEHSHPLRDLTQRSIKGQEPNWKNALSRQFIKFEDCRQSAKETQEGFWFSEPARRVVDAATFFSGYIFLGELTFQKMDPEKYAEFADGLRDTFQAIGLEPDTNFARWQMSDFFGAAWYAFWLEKYPLKLARSAIPEKGMFGKSKEWYEENAPLISAVTIGTTLTAYEVLQAHMNKGPIDIKDITAYMAGLGLYLGSEKIFQEYLKLKDEFKGKMLPFFKERLGGIRQDYEKGILVVNELMENVKLPRKEK